MPLARERLTALLAESALTSVELVIAPPGYGKTTVLREYAAADSGAVFISLPDSTDLEAFVRAVIAAAVPSALRSIGAVFEGSNESNVEARATDWLLSRLRALNGTLIIDDFHRSAGDERVARVLVATIGATHGRMRWIVASRESPAFPMGSWIARGWMGLPITSDDLAFTANEASALAGDLGIAVSQDGVESIVRDTLGWPIGVRLALSLVTRKRGVRQTRVQTREALFALLGNEVWQPLDEDLRQLVAAAVLMPAPSIRTLAAAGLPSARERMTRIFARVPFVQAIDDDAFAIHDLFREFVAAQTISDPAGTGGVAARMGSALVAGGNPADGLRLLIGTADVDGVKETLAEHAFELLETGQRSAVAAAITFLTERGLGDDGIVLAIRGAFSYFDGSGSNAANLLARALRRSLPSQMRCEVVGRLALSHSNGGDGRAALKVLAPACNDPTMNPEDQLYTRALFLAIRAVNGEHAGITHEMAECERAVSIVTPRIQARVLQRLAYASYYTGDLTGAERLALSAAQLAAELSMDALTATCYAMLYNIASQVDRNTQRARAFLRAQAAAAERAANTALRVNALQNEFILTAVNAESEAAHTIETLLAKLTDSRTYRNAWGVVIGRTLLQVAAGNLRQAEATLASPTSGLLPAEQAFCDALLVLLMLARGDRPSAVHALQRGLLVEAAGDHHSIVFLNCAYALRAVAFWMLDRPLQARRSFAFDVTMMPRHYRILVEALRSLIELPHPPPNRDAADGICREFEEADFGGYAVLVRCLVARDANEVALSATEIETLRVFDRYGGRATDVAKALGKSKFTVQNQIQSAIKKIGCSGRAEALAYARQRGWLDATDG